MVIEIRGCTQYGNRLFNQIISNNDLKVISVFIFKICSDGFRQSSMFDAT